MAFFVDYWKSSEQLLYKFKVVLSFSRPQLISITKTTENFISDDA